MKNLFITLLFGVSALVANAQNGFKWEWTPKYFGEVHIGYNTSSKVGGIKTYSAAADVGTLQGVSINKYLQAGIGIDGIMLTHYYKGQGLRWGLSAYSDFRFLYPVSDDFSPFLNLALGAAVSLKPKGDGAEFYCEFGPGLKYKKFNLSCGLMHIGKGEGTNHFFVKTGFYF